MSLGEKQKQAERETVLRQFPKTIEHVSGPDPDSFNDDSPIVLCLIKDGAKYIDSFIEHHHKLGLSQFLFLDNGSDDGTVEILTGRDGVSVLSSEYPFLNNSANIRHYLLERYAKDRWGLVLDIDELFDYPFSSNVSLRQLVDYLESRNFDAVQCQIIDRYPEHLINSPSDRFDPANHRFYETESLTVWQYPEHLGCVIGDGVYIHLAGVRARIFGTDKICLSKVALVRGGRELRYYNNHFARGANIADVSAVLWHFKFTGDFHDLVEKAVSEGNYWNNSAEYRAYQNLTQTSDRIYMVGPHTRLYTSTDQLVEEGTLVVSKSYRDVAAGSA